MTVRAVWKGYLKFGELNCPVSLFTAISTAERISLKLVSSGEMHSVKRTFVDSVTGEEVDREQQIKGYEIGKDKYVTLEQDEIEQAAAENDKTLHVAGFLPLDHTDDLYLRKPYFAAPQDAAARETYLSFRDALARTSSIAIAKATLFRRARTIALTAHENGLVAEVLRYNYEVRAAKTIFAEIGQPKITKEMLSLAEHIITQKKGSFDPSAFKDRYEEALASLVKAKMAGKKISAPAPPKTSKVVNLLEALRKSAASPAKIAATIAAKSAQSPSKKSAAPKRRTSTKVARGSQPARSVAKRKAS